MKKGILFFFLLSTIHATFAQQKLSIQFIDKDKGAAIGVSTSLRLVSDSTKQQFAVADTNGIVNFKVEKNQKYSLKATAVGFKDFKKEISSRENFIVLTLDDDATALKSVEVVARRPLLRQEEDKTIVDPEILAPSSSSAFEIIEKTPGIFTDADGNIYVNGMTPANIYINGSEQRMSRDDIATILRSLPPNSIEKMEIIRSPSAKYDASGGNGGIINIVLKKNVKIGRNGSVGFFGNQGQFGNQNVNLNLTNSEGGLSTYFNINLGNQKRFDEVDTRRVIENGSSLYAQNAFNVIPSQSFYTGYGLSKEINKKMNFGYDGRVSRNISQTNTENSIDVSKTPSNEVLSSFLNVIDNNNKNFSINQELSATRKIDTIGSEITAQLNYNFLNVNNFQEYGTSVLIPNRVTFGGFGDIDSRRHFGFAKLDVKYKLPKSFSVESGIKSSIQRFSNLSDFSLIAGNRTQQDPVRTNSFTYDDVINSVYLQGLKTIKKFTIKTGVRLENTQMLGNQIIPYDTTFRVNRNDLFPFAYLSRELVKIANFPLIGTLTYNRAIARPGYDLLNPFAKYLDQFTFDVGNPTLQPQFTTTYEANIVAGGYPIFAIGKRFVDDIFTNVVYQDPIDQRIVYRTYDNLSQNEETYFRATLAVPPGKKYFAVFFSQYSRNNYDGIYENLPINFNRGSWTLFMLQEYKITPTTKIQANGFMLLKGQSNFYELSNLGSLNFSINQMLMKKKLNLNLAVNDVLYTNRNNFVLNQGTVAASGSRRADTRRISMSLRYNFGLKKKEEKQNMFDIGEIN